MFTFIAKKSYWIRLGLTCVSIWTEYDGRIVHYKEEQVKSVVLSLYYHHRGYRSCL